MKCTSLPLHRREFITLLGGAAAAWPLAARAQQPASAGASAVSESARTARRTGSCGFSPGPEEAGWIEGRERAIEYTLGRRHMRNDIRRHCGRVGSPPSRCHRWPSATQQRGVAKRQPDHSDRVRAVGDPVGAGLLTALARPGGNVTGCNFRIRPLARNGWNCCKKSCPTLDASGRPARSRSSLRYGQLRRHPVRGAVAREWSSTPIDHATAPSEIERALTAFARRSVPAALIVTAGGSVRWFIGDLIVTLAARHDLPAVYWDREFVDAGGLDLLRQPIDRPIPSRGRLRRPHPQGREARRPAGQAADQVRARDQPQDRQGAWPRQCRQRCSPAPTR